MSESKDGDTSWQEDEFFDLTTGQIVRDRAAFETNQREREVRALIDARIARKSMRSRFESPLASCYSPCFWPLRD
jgi:hypothetical protein